MKRPTMLIMAIALTVSIAGVAAAQTCPGHLTRRVARQESRIRQGVHAGQLTRRETVGLRQGQRDILTRRAARQELRIRQGVHAGQLTRRETVRLRQGQRDIRRMELRAWADGQVGPRERVRLNRALDRQSGRIWRLKHNGRAV